MTHGRLAAPGRQAAGLIPGDVREVLLAAVVVGDRIVLSPAGGGEARRAACACWRHRAGSGERRLRVSRPGGRSRPDGAAERRQVPDGRAGCDASPPGLAALLLGELGDDLNGLVLLEPSAGQGTIAIPAAERGAVVDCIEAVPEYARDMEQGPGAQDDLRRFPGDQPAAPVRRHGGASPVRRGNRVEPRHAAVQWPSREGGRRGPAGGGHRPAGRAGAAAAAAGRRERDDAAGPRKRLAVPGRRRTGVRQLHQARAHPAAARPAHCSSGRGMGAAGHLLINRLSPWPGCRRHRSPDPDGPRCRRPASLPCGRRAVRGAL